MNLGIKGETIFMTEREELQINNTSTQQLQGCLQRTCKAGSLLHTRPQNQKPHQQRNAR